MELILKNLEMGKGYKFPAEYIKLKCNSNEKLAQSKLDFSGVG